MFSGNYSNIYLRNAYTNHVADNWACGSPNDILCENSGSGNTFSSVVNCPNDWLGNGGYTEC